MRAAVATAAAVAAFGLAILAPTTAHAQPAFAIGHPLEAPDFDVGEISVRVIAGSVAKPVIGVEVTLLVEGTPRVARTDSGGRAFFKELAPGASVQAVIKDADGKDVQSDTFQVPDSGGMHVMLSTSPVDPNAMGGGGGGPPFAGGAGMPDPRQISGVARPEQKNPPGTLTVRVTYDDLKDKVPNIPVTLVSYASDGKIGVVVKQTDADGRALFDNLDVSGNLAYYAMAQPPRNGAFDRVVSAPVVLAPQVGMALLLSAEKVDATTPPVDDQVRLDKQNEALVAGQVEVSLDGNINEMNPVSLVEIPTHRIVGHVLPDHFAPDITNIQAKADQTPRPDEAAGTLDVTIHGGAGSTNQPLGGIAVNLFAVDDKELKTPFPGTTNASGAAHWDLKPGAYHAVITMNGKDLNSPPIDLTAAGVSLDVLAQWEAVGRLRGLFSDIPVTPGQTLYAEIIGKDKQPYKSAPFQLVGTHGTSASIRAVPVFFSFHIVTGVEDQLLAVQGQYTLMNFGWQPYTSGPDGLVVPVPRGFKGIQIADRDQAIAGVATGIGFLVPRPLPPAGPTIFHGAFSMPVSNSGNVAWSQDLPFGTVQSWMRMIQLPTMSVEVPPGTHGDLVDTEEGPMYQIAGITIPPGHAMELSIHGLPTPPAWKIWLPRVIGVLVVVVMFAGIFLAVTRPATAKPAADAAREARRSKLLDEVVELERSGKDQKRRESLMAELEKLWDTAA